MRSAQFPFFISPLLFFIIGTLALLAMSQRLIMVYLLWSMLLEVPYLIIVVNLSAILACWNFKLIYAHILIP
uniref:Uncharacterized protein n=1 Tax=Wuchereria bancrofti TaxID=6293 RepID=A0A1I8EGU5_WUCBA